MMQAMDRVIVDYTVLISLVATWLRFPPYDLSGKTALTGANLMFELLSILPGVPYR